MRICSTSPIRDPVLQKQREELVHGIHTDGPRSAVPLAPAAIPVHRLLLNPTLAYGPAFTCGDHPHLCVSADQHVRTEVVVSRYELPLQRQTKKLDRMRSEIRGAARGPGRSFCPEGAWAFELFWFCLLASWCPIAHPAAAPSLPWPAIWPATPPTMAPLMHPLAPPARPRRVRIGSLLPSSSSWSLSELLVPGDQAAWRRAVPHRMADARRLPGTRGAGFPDAPRRVNSRDPLETRSIGRPDRGCGNGPKLRYFAEWHQM